MDGLALRLRKMVDCEFPSDEEILMGILESVHKQRLLKANEGA
jgi:formylmethanofuran dehydrogenase subunit B